MAEKAGCIEKSFIEWGATGRMVADADVDRPENDE
jgi:hypothetical protein